MHHNIITRHKAHSRQTHPVPAKLFSAVLGIGQARNRLQLAVERTVPFQFAVYSLVILWYTLYGHHRDDLAGRRAAQPWYRSKDEPAFEDMLIKLRRTLVAAQISGVTAAQPDPHKYHEYELACAAAAA